MNPVDHRTTNTAGATAVQVKDGGAYPAAGMEASSRGMIEHRKRAGENTRSRTAAVGGPGMPVLQGKHGL